MLVLVLHFALCFWCKSCMLHIVLELEELTIRVSGPLILQWRTGSLVRRIQSLSFVILKLCRNTLLGLLGLWTLSSLLGAPVGGSDSRSLLWFLPRFPAPILVRFFLASECPMRRIRARLALYCMRWGIQPPRSVVFALCLPLFFSVFFLVFILFFNTSL